MEPSLSKVFQGLQAEFEPIREGLRRAVVESDNREFRKVALSHLDVADVLVEMDKPGGNLTDSVRAVYAERLKTHAATIAQHVVTEDWPQVLYFTYQLLEEPPGKPTTIPVTPLPLPLPVPEGSS